MTSGQDAVFADSRPRVRGQSPVLQRNGVVKVPTGEQVGKVEFKLVKRSFSYCAPEACVKRLAQGCGTQEQRKGL